MPTNLRWLSRWPAHINLGLTSASARTALSLANPSDRKLLPFLGWNWMNLDNLYLILIYHYVNNGFGGYSTWKLLNTAVMWNLRLNAAHHVSVQIRCLKALCGGKFGNFFTRFFCVFFTNMPCTGSLIWMAGHHVSVQIRCLKAAM